MNFWMPCLLMAFVTAACNTNSEGTGISFEEMETIARDVSEGNIEQDGLLALSLSPEEQRVFTRVFGRIRGWDVTAANLDLAVRLLFQQQNADFVNLDGTMYGVTGDQHNFGACAQFVEQASGSIGTSYVAGMQNPSQNECGPDSDDKILVFNIYWGGTDPNNARYYSGLWWVRSWLSVNYANGLSTNGLCGNTAHMCMGTRGLVLSTNDLYSIYLWHL